MKSDLFQLLEANIKIISYFENVDDIKIEKYENMVNKFISFDVIKTKEVLLDCILEYETKINLKEESAETTVPVLKNIRTQKLLKNYFTYKYA